MQSFAFSDSDPNYQRCSDGLLRCVAAGGGLMPGAMVGKSAGVAITMAMAAGNIEIHSTLGRGGMQRTAVPQIDAEWGA